MSENYINYFNENCIEDQEFTNLVLKTSAARLNDQFRLKFCVRDGSNPDGSARYAADVRLVGAIFCKIFDSILTSLEIAEKSYSNFDINMAKRLIIGYSTTEDDDDEKQGNFMIYLKDLGFEPRRYEKDDSIKSSNELCAAWNSENITEQPEIIKKISETALKMLKSDIDIEFNSSELVMPIFVTIYETLVSMLKTHRREIDEFEYEINFMSCFFIGARESEFEDIIYIRPNIESKLRLKNDSLASAKYE